MVAAAERGRLPRPPRPDDFRKLMESPCPFHPKDKHAGTDCYALKRFVEENTHHSARNQDDPDRNQGQLPDGSGFPDAQRELHMIYGGSAAYESKRKQKLTTREINAVTPTTPKYLKWSEAMISFDRSDHPVHIPHPERYPLVLDPIVKNVKLKKMLINGGSALNILFAKTLDGMKILRFDLN